MDLDHNLMFHHVSIFAPLLLILATCLTIFYKLRKRWPIKVNCWFCNEDAKILRQNLNWWLCPWCEQYNGFSKTGDYSFNIPEQYATLNKCVRYCKAIKNICSSPSICMNCNERESLKLIALSNFKPKYESFYDQELKAFKEDLEKKYPICDKCKSIVSSVLNKQALWLTRYKMLFFRQKPVIVIINNSRKLEIVFRVISIILDLVVIYNYDLMWLPIGGLCFHLCAWIFSIKRKNYNVLLTFLWLYIILLASIKNLMIPQVFWLTIEHIVQYHMITICACVIVFVSIKANSYKNILTGSVAFKKLRCKQNVYDNENDSILNEMSSNNIETNSEINELSFTEIKPQLERLKPFTATDSNCRNNTNFLSQNKNSSHDSLDDSLRTLSLNENVRNNSSDEKVTATIFERKIYNTTSSENLFKKSSGASNKKYILSPPKLKSVTQTSWVAGGYWQENMITTPSTLSRSSSQSSGFGSASSSNLAFSREPSVHEFDRCSVISDGTRSCHTPRLIATNPTVKHDSPVPQLRYSETAINNDRSLFVSSPLLCATTTMRNAKNRIQENYVSRNVDVNHRNDLMPIYPSHMTTIIANPSWLSAMFCGSLILNIIVLCIMLLQMLY